MHKINELIHLNTKKLFALTFLFCVIVFSGLLLSSCNVSDDDKKTAENLINDADSLVEEDKYAQAVAKYEEASNVDPGNYSSYYGIANIYILKNRFDDAIETLDIGISNARQKSLLYEQKGDVYLIERKYDDAAECFKNAVEKDNKNYSADYKLAYSYLNSGDFDKARGKLNIDEDAGDYYIKAKLLQAALLNIQVDDISDIIDDLKNQDTEDAQLVAYINMYSDVLDKISSLDQDEASDLYKSMLLSKVALSMGYEDIVINMLSAYENDVEEYWELNLYLGQAYYLNEDLDTAKEYLNEANTLNPSDYVSNWILGRVYDMEDDESRLIDYYQRAIELSDPSNKTVIRLEYISVLKSRELYTQAQSQYEILCEEDKENEDSYKLAIAEILISRTYFEDAGNSISDIQISSLSDDDLAKYNWINSLIMLDQGDYDKAQEWIDEAINLRDNIAEYYLVSGKIYFEQSNDKKAKEFLERAIDLDLNGDVSVEANKILDRI